MEAACFFETLVSTYHTPQTQEITVFMFTLFRLSHLTQLACVTGLLLKHIRYLGTASKCQGRHYERHVSGQNQGHAENSVNTKLKINQGQMLLEDFAHTVTSSSHSLTSLPHSIALHVQMRQCL